MVFDESWSIEVYDFFDFYVSKGQFEVSYIPENANIYVLKTFSPHYLPMDCFRYRSDFTGYEFFLRHTKLIGSKYVGYATVFDHKQALLLSQLMSEKKMCDRQYNLPALQEILDAAHKKIEESSPLRKRRWFRRKKENTEFRNMVYDEIHAREVFIRGKGIITNPTVIDIDGKLEYEGDVIEAEINTKDVVGTLINAGLLEKPLHKIITNRDKTSIEVGFKRKPRKRIHSGRIFFNDSGEASVRTRWDYIEGEFYARAGEPHKVSQGVIAFVEPDKELEIEPVPREKIERIRAKDRAETYARLSREHSALKELVP